MYLHYLSKVMNIVKVILILLKHELHNYVYSHTKCGDTGMYIFYKTGFLLIRGWDTFTKGRASCFLVESISAAEEGSLT